MMINFCQRGNDLALSNCPEGAVKLAYQFKWDVKKKKSGGEWVKFCREKGDFHGFDNGIMLLKVK